MERAASIIAGPKKFPDIAIIKTIRVAAPGGCEIKGEEQRERERERKDTFTVASAACNDDKTIESQ